MGLEKILCFFWIHKLKRFEKSDFEYYCARCYKPYIKKNAFYTDIGALLYYQNLYPKLLEKLKTMKNEAKTNPKE